ncbi:MAG: glycosyltransferase family 9 protein [Candidatus Kapaibacterium sp.]
MDTRKVQEEYARKRRTDIEFAVRPSLAKRFAQWLERINKAVWLQVLRMLLRTKHVDHAIDPNRIQSVLILRYDAIGDMIVTTPFWRNLKRLNPQLRIGVAASARNIDVIRADDDVDVRFLFSEGALLQTIRGIREVRKQKWDVVLALVYKKKTKGAIIARLCSPKGVTSTAIKEEGLSRSKILFSHVTQFPNPVHPVPTNEFLRSHFEGIFGLNIAADAWHASLRIDPVVESRTHDRIKKILLADAAGGFVHINIESATPFREWGLANNLALSKWIIESYPGLSVLWTSSPTQAVSTNAFLAANPNARLHHFETSDVHELFTVVRNSTLVISPDTSIIHIAGAELKPTVGLFVEQNEWLPSGVPNRVLFPEKGSPVSSITLDSVKRAVSELLDR